MKYAYVNKFFNFDVDVSVVHTNQSIETNLIGWISDRTESLYYNCIYNERMRWAISFCAGSASEFQVNNNWTHKIRKDFVR